MFKPRNLRLLKPNFSTFLKTTTKLTLTTLLTAKLLSTQVLLDEGQDFKKLEEKLLKAEQNTTQINSVPKFI